MHQGHLPCPHPLSLCCAQVLYYKMLKGLSGDKKLAARTRFMIRDLLDLREDKYEAPFDCDAWIVWLVWMRSWGEKSLPAH